MSDANVILEMRDVGRVHSNRTGSVRVLGPVSLTVMRGELVAIMGPSGSGKSTLLAIAGALDRPTEGRVIVAGRELATLDATQLAELRRRTFGCVSRT